MSKLKELEAEHAKRLRQLKNADPEQIGFLKKKITRLEDEMKSLEAVEMVKPVGEIDIIIKGKKATFNKAGVYKLPYNSILKRVDQKHYIIIFDSNTAQDAELSLQGSEWQISCCDTESFPVFEYEELGLAIGFILDNMKKKSKEIKVVKPVDKPVEVSGKYKLGDMYSSDFDIEGMLITAWGLKQTETKELNLLHDSLEDNNYHTIGIPLWAFLKGEGGFSEFRKELKAEMEEQGIKVVDPVKEKEVQPRKTKPIKSLKKPTPKKKVDSEGEDINELKRYLAILQDVKAKSKGDRAKRQINKEISKVEQMIEGLE